MAQTELGLEAVKRYVIEHKVPENQRVGYLESPNCASAKRDEGDRITWVN